MQASASQNTASTNHYANIPDSWETFPEELPSRGDDCITPQQVPNSDTDRVTDPIYSDIDLCSAEEFSENSQKETNA